MEKGWIKLYRRILENSFLMHDQNAFNVFIKLIMLVGKEKGQWAGGRRQLAEWVDINDRTLYDVLLRLQNNGMISIESKERYSVISITNWSIYQAKSSQKNNTLPTKRPTLIKQMSIEYDQPISQPQANHKPTTSQHSNKNKKENKNNNSNKLELAKPEFGDPKINEVFKIWENEIGYPINSKITLNRHAAKNLIAKYDLEKLSKIIHGVSLAHQDRYGPQISDFIDLQANFNKLMLWGKKQNNQSVGGTIKI